MEHGGAPVEAAGDDKFVKLGAFEVAAPVAEGREALPAVFAGQGGEIDPKAAGEVFGVGAALFVGDRVEVVAGGQFPGAGAQGFALRAILGDGAQVDAPIGLAVEFFAHDHHPAGIESQRIEGDGAASVEPILAVTRVERGRQRGISAFEAGEGIPTGFLDDALTQGAVGFISGIVLERDETVLGTVLHVEQFDDRSALAGDVDDDL